MHHSVFHAPPVPKPGDTVRVIAPAGPFDRTLFFRGLGFLAQTFKVKWNTDVFLRKGFLAGTAAQRSTDFQSALECPDTRLVICARGGVGSAELLSSLSTLDYPHKWLVGFSDITALHAAMHNHGWMSIHGPNVASLGIGNATLRERFVHHVLNPLRRHSLALTPLHPGAVTGPLIGGNLAVLHDLCVAGAWHPPAGAILFIEEVAEAPYRIYRMLTAMHRGGHLKQIAGLVVGQVTLSHAGPHRVTARQVITELCQQWELPAAWGLASGHDPRENDPLTFGTPARLTVTAEAATVELNSEN